MMMILLLIYLTAAAVVLAETIDKQQQQQQQQHQFPLPPKNTQKIQIDFNYYLSTIDNATSTSSIPATSTSTVASTTIDDDDDDEEREKERLRKKYNVQRNPVADLKNFPEKRYVSCCVLFSLLCHYLDYCFYICFAGYVLFFRIVRSI